MFPPSSDPIQSEPRQGDRPVNRPPSPDPRYRRPSDSPTSTIVHHRPPRRVHQRPLSSTNVCGVGLSRLATFWLHWPPQAESTAQKRSPASLCGALGYRSGGHEIRTRNRFPGTTFPVWPLAIRLPSVNSYPITVCAKHSWSSSPFAAARTGCHVRRLPSACEADAGVGQISWMGRIAVHLATKVAMPGLRSPVTCPRKRGTRHRARPLRPGTRQPMEHDQGPLLQEGGSCRSSLPSSCSSYNLDTVAASTM